MGSILIALFKTPHQRHWHHGIYGDIDAPKMKPCDSKYCVLNVVTIWYIDLYTAQLELSSRRYHCSPAGAQYHCSPDGAQYHCSPDGAQYHCSPDGATKLLMVLLGS